MATKTKKMTIKYWNSLSENSRWRALKHVFPLMPATIEMMALEKPDLNNGLWKTVFKAVRIPGPGSFYKTVVNNTYLN